MEEFEKGTGVLGTSTQFAAGYYVLLSLYRFFAAVNDQQVENGPPVGLIIAAAEKERKGRPNKPK